MSVCENACLKKDDEFQFLVFVSVFFLSVPLLFAWMCSFFILFFYELDMLILLMYN